MTKSQRVPLTLTPERLQMFEAIWQHLPHLRGSVAATVDYVGSAYLDGKSSRILTESNSAPDTASDASIEREDAIAADTESSKPAFIEDEWA